MNSKALHAMKFFFCILTLVALSARAQAQSYSINKFAIAGGGGLNSTGGTYAVSGTIGQPDASGPAGWRASMYSLVNFSDER